MAFESAAPTRMAAFWRTLIHFDRAKLTPWLALRNTIGVIAPLLAGAAMGNVLTGVAAATGALNVAFSDSHAPYQQRARRLLAATVMVALAVFTGGVVGHNDVLAVAVGMAWAFAAGMLVALSPAAGDVGTISLVTLIVFSARPASVETAAIAGALALAGGLLQAALSLVLWPVRRYQPERRALADLYDQLARMTQDRIRTSEAPPVTAQAVNAHQALAALNQDHSVESERYQLILSQAERIRLSILALDGMRRRLERQPGPAVEGILSTFYEQVSTVLHAIASSLRVSESHANARPPIDSEATAERLRALESEPHDHAVAAMWSDVLFQVDALNGQLRAAADLAASTSFEGDRQFQLREAQQPWRLRLGGRFATLRANFSLESAACRHAVRLSACVALGDAVGRGFHLDRSYWIPMTIAIVLKPDFASTFSRGVLRLVGTFAGLVIATLLFHFLPDVLPLQIALLAMFLFLLRWVGPANYGIFVAAVSGIVVVLIAITGIAPNSVMAVRGLNTLYGGLLALGAYWVWPTWERGQISGSLAQMLESYCDYSRAVNRRFLQRRAEDKRELERARITARLARSNIEASAERFRVEPRTTAEEMTILSSILASSHRFIHAVMAIEAGLRAHRLEGDSRLFAEFAEDVERMLRYLSARLRGGVQKPVLPELVDLRKKQQALQRADRAAGYRNNIIEAETDRIANSLNTLREQVERWRLQ